MTTLAAESIAVATNPLTAAVTDAAETTSNTGEAIVFWIVAPLAVLGALGLVFSRKAVHGAMSLAVTMIGLAVLYIVQEAPFLGVVQIVVYTGAIMMLFLFVVMLVGVDASDSRIETIKGQRGWTAVLVIGLVVLFSAIISRAALPEPAGMAGATPEGNVYGVADLLFGRYVAVFEVIAALLITAAIGAMTLTHREAIFRGPSQRELSERRFREGAPEDAAGLPVPGVYARHNAVDVPALLPDGSPALSSVSRVLDVRGSVRSVDEFADDVVELSDNAEEAEGGKGRTAPGEWGSTTPRQDADTGSGPETGESDVSTDGPTGGVRE